MKSTAAGPSCIRCRKLNYSTMTSSLLTWSWEKLLVSQKAVNHFIFSDFLRVQCVAPLFLLPPFFSLQTLCCRLFVTFHRNIQTPLSRPANCRSSSVCTLRRQGQSLSRGHHQTGMTSEIQSLEGLYHYSDLFIVLGWPDWIFISRPKFLEGIADQELRNWAEKIHHLWKSLGRKVVIMK